ncbi:MAG TPA: PQQ-dependent sugar dehydrogenase [Chitinophagaceae bacterium]|nr:PQQ-dependent sugar dehydrogenase [Chitinophagaceae bacterium]
MDSTDTRLNLDTTAFTLVKHHIVLTKGIDLDLSIPKGYGISVAAEGLPRLRFLTKSPDGRLFATGMYDKSDNRKGVVYSFTDWDDSLHQFKTTRTFLHHLHNPNQAVFYVKGDSSYLYVAETSQLVRYRYVAGDTMPTGNPQVIATFPDYGLSYKYGGWHLTRSIAFHNDKLYVSVGSSCNACIEKEPVRATILQMNPDGSDQQIFASGLRNAVGILWMGNQLWATSMGRDLIGPDKPEDLLQTVEQGKIYHWPYFYQYQQQVYPDVQMQDSAVAQHIAIPPMPPTAFAGFKAHSAPLGLAYFKAFDDPQLNNALLVALHGSTSVWRERGNAIVKVNGGNNYVAVVTGFLTGKTEADRKGRPCDVLMNDRQSFFFTDDHNGVLYYVWKEKQ